MAVEETEAQKAMLCVPNETCSVCSRVTHHATAALQRRRYFPSQLLPSHEGFNFGGCLGLQ